MIVSQKRFRNFLLNHQPYLEHCYKTIPVLQKVSFSAFASFAFDHSYTRKYESTL
jgi:hypothetical protein